MEAVATRKLSKVQQIEKRARQMTGDDRIRVTEYGLLRFTPGDLGPCYMGAWHEHECPRCRRKTSGTGVTLCPGCASRNLVHLKQIAKHGQK